MRKARAAPTPIAQERPLAFPRSSTLIRTAAGCCVLIVHHSGKNIEAGARGNSALKGAMDTEVELLGDDARIEGFSLCVATA